MWSNGLKVSFFRVGLTIMPDFDCHDTITIIMIITVKGLKTLIANESFLTARQRFTMIVGWMIFFLTFDTRNNIKNF